MMDEQEFQREASQALDSLYKRLAAAADGSDFEPDYNAGALTVEFEDPPAKFVVSPNSPVRQIWVSALTRSFKLDWNAERKEFVLAGSGETLAGLIEHVLSQQLGEAIEL